MEVQAEQKVKMAKEEVKEAKEEVREAKEEVEKAEKKVKEAEEGDSKMMAKNHLDFAVNGVKLAQDEVKSALHGLETSRGALDAALELYHKLAGDFFSLKKCVLCSFIITHLHHICLHSDDDQCRFLEIGCIAVHLLQISYYLLYLIVCFHNLSSYCCFVF
jgi:hypothetical protein